MAESRRKLAAILAAGVVGYSRLMGDDERATVAALIAGRKVFRRHIAEHHGRVVDTAGDSVLAVFDSVVEAVQCSIGVQIALAGQNANIDEGRRMDFRIGVNLGDIIEQEDGTIYGDGVNVAARLESLAEPGGICLSGSALEQIEGKIAYATEDIGAQEVKNIARPVRAHRIVLGEAPKPTTTPPSSRPSIAVLPFQNLSRDPEQDFLADGISEDLTTELSRLRWLKVIARNTMFTYRDKAVDVAQLAADLGVRYVLEGSVRKSGGRVRITAQLIEAENGTHLWAERYDRELDDIFALQDEITLTIAGALQGEVTNVERDRASRKPPSSFDAWECYQRGVSCYLEMTPTSFGEAIELYQRAIELDPGFASAHAALAYCLYYRIAYAMSQAPGEDLSAAMESAQTALALDDRDDLAHSVAGRVYLLQGDFEAARKELEASVRLNPSSSFALFSIASVCIYELDFDPAIDYCTQAIDISPHDPMTWSILNTRCMAYFLKGDYEAALVDANNAIRSRGPVHWPYTMKVASLVELDRLEEARAEYNLLAERFPGLTIERLALSLAPNDPQGHRARFPVPYAAMRKAGMPESAG